MKLKTLVLNNIGLKAIALLLAIIVWILIVGKERAFSEKSFDVNVDYINKHDNIEIKNIYPDQVRVEVTGNRRIIGQLTDENFRVEVDLENISKSSRINRWVMDYLQYPDEIEILSVRPRTIEIVTEELTTKEVAVEVRMTGRLRGGLRLVSVSINPPRVRIRGYKDRIEKIGKIYTKGVIDLSELEGSIQESMALDKREHIIKIEETSEVQVTLEVENPNDRSKKSPRP
jgi:YbbR domain-containing protein